MKGYTLIEVVIAVMLLAIILLGGTSLFFQNLRSSGLSEVDLNLTSSLGQTMSSIERDARFSQVVEVDSGTRTDCEAAGASGYSGTSLTVKDLDGLDTVYSLSGTQIASVAAVTGRSTFISSSDISVSRLAFTWFCQSGVNDKLMVEIDASSTVLGSGVVVTRSLSTQIDLLNSGIN